MRKVVIVLTLGCGGAWLVLASQEPNRRSGPVAAALEPRRAPGPLYDSDPDHIWNLVDRQLRVRVGTDGSVHGGDAVDPLLWRETRHLLTPPSSTTTLAVLDEFLETNAERLVTEPLPRAILQRDLWAVFDWAVSRRDVHADARHALATRLARIIRRIALTADEIAKLPDSYATTVAGGRYAARDDAEQRDSAFLPLQLFDTSGPWIPIHGDVPVAQHSDEMSRSHFGVFLNLPGGRAATLDHLRTLWNAPQPFVVDPIGSFGGQQRTTINPALQALPHGTQIALARRMLLIDTTGEIRPTALVESLQIRVFRQAEPCRRTACGANDQDFFEFVLDRNGLLANASLGLRAVGSNEGAFLTFSSHGIDPFEHTPTTIRLNPTLQMCVNCHHEPGLASIRTARRLFKPYTLADGGGPGGNGMAEFWKTRRSDWGYLQALWQTVPR